MKGRIPPFMWVVLALALGVVWYRMASQPVARPGANAATVRVVVPRGATVNRTARILQERGVIRSAALFRWTARLTGRNKVLAGTYAMAPSWTMDRILDELERGVPETTVRVTFPEGYRLEQTAERAAQAPAVDRAEFLRLASTGGRAFRAPFAPPANLEGYLFPDTYEFDRKDTARDAIQKMLDNFDRRVVNDLAADIWQARDEGMSLRQILIIASLVEREARLASEQPTIAGVIFNRLKRNMPLQIDATVQYAIGHRERLLYRDLKADSPYNTYKNVGLPPGPICSPGLSAIQAALRPAAVPYLYYTARPDGSHTFTTTFEEHKRATQEARAESNRKGDGGG